MEGGVASPRFHARIGNVGSPDAKRGACHYEELWRNDEREELIKEVHLGRKGASLHMFPLFFSDL
jgi:hypothetical protein